MITSIYMPNQKQRDLRDLTRYRASQVDDRTRVVNRLQKVLEDANLKLASVVNDVRGVPARAMLEAIVAGEIDPEALADLPRGRLEDTHAAQAEALTGVVREHHLFLLAQLLRQPDGLKVTIGRLDARIEEEMRPFEMEGRRHRAGGGRGRLERMVVSLFPE